MGYIFEVCFDLGTLHTDSVACFDCTHDLGGSSVGLDLAGTVTDCCMEAGLGNSGDTGLAVGAGDCILPAWAFADSSFDLLG